MSQTFMRLPLFDEIFDENFDETKYKFLPLGITDAVEKFNANPALFDDPSFAKFKKNTTRSIFLRVMSKKYNDNGYCVTFAYIAKEKPVFISAPQVDMFAGLDLRASSAPGLGKKTPKRKVIKNKRKSLKRKSLKRKL